MVVTIVDHEQDKELATIRILQSIKFMLQMEANAASGLREQISTKRGHGEGDESLSCRNQ
jgi:hypothetical protein